MTSISLDKIPSVCFYKIGDQSQMAAMPEYRIDGAEMFLSSENTENNGKVRFLINRHNLKKANSGNMSQEELIFIRMISTTMIIEISLEELKTL